MVIDIGAELIKTLLSSEYREQLYDLVREAVRAEMRAALDAELIDTNQAAEILGMTPGAVRKAVERRQLPCVRMGRRLRFRRSELLTARAETE